MQPMKLEKKYSPEVHSVQKILPSISRKNRNQDLQNDLSVICFSWIVNVVCYSVGVMELIGV
jgi:hypothetical protein